MNRVPCNRLMCPYNESGHCDDDGPECNGGNSDADCFDMNSKQRAVFILMAEEEAPTFKIVRVYRDFRLSKIIKTGLTEKEAQAHCTDPTTAGDGWMDTYRKEN